MTDNGYGKAAEDYIKNATSVFEQLDRMDAETRKIIYASIAKNGLSTREGINKVIEDAKKAG